MNQQRSLGLIGTGNAAGSALARLPEFLKRLGPVKSVSLRVASRLVNTLGAGFPVDQFEALQRCEAIFVIVPDAQAAATILDLASAPIAWAGKVVILSDTWLSSGTLESLSVLGAETGSVCLVDFSADSRFLMEGARPAITEMKRLLRQDARSLTVNPESKPLVHAALTFSESLLFPLFAAADECLRLAGVPYLQAGALLEGAAVRASRAYGKSGRKAWSGPLANEESYLMGRQIAALSSQDPILAQFFVKQCARALEFFGRESAWISALQTQDSPDLPA
ncbi:MAG TPA: DUF2520 domain-containing protein [Bryobacteraceae bacterium]|nr:DUF2520 domain-containing protein [Bryobacteraceae bacterium]